MAADDRCVLGIDAGTGGLRAGLFDLHGRPLGFAEVPYETSFPAPGRAEQQPQDWWRALVDAVRSCRAQAAVDAARVIGLAIDAPANIFLVDKGGSPLTQGLLWMDLRGSMQAARLSATEAPVLRYCGGAVPAEWPLPKALWLKEQEPALWNVAPLLVETAIWLTWRLTGVWAAALGSAVCKWHYRPGDGWPTSLMVQGGLWDLPKKLPSTVLPMGARVGGLTNAAATALGLEPGTAVAISGIDEHAGMVGLNALAPGTLALITGSSTCQLTLAPDPVFDSGIWGPFQDAVLPGAWLLEAGQASTGSTVRWMTDLLDGSALGGNSSPDAAGHEPLEALAAAVPPGAEGLTILDHWQGSRTPIRDPGSRGAVWGLTLAHGAGHLVRAVYEGTAYGNRQILERLAGLGVPIERLVACGSATRSALWLQILADSVQTPIALTAVPNAVELGSAICAAVGAGAFSDLASAASAMVQPGGTVLPDPALKDVYAMGYRTYLKTYEHLARLRDERDGGHE